MRESNPRPLSRAREITLSTVEPKIIHWAALFLSCNFCCSTKHCWGTVTSHVPVFLTSALTIGKIEMFFEKRESLSFALSNHLHRFFRCRIEKAFYAGTWLKLRKMGKRHLGRVHHRESKQTGCKKVNAKTWMYTGAEPKRWRFRWAQSVLLDFD